MDLTIARNTHAIGQLNTVKRTSGDKDVTSRGYLEGKPVAFRERDKHSVIFLLALRTASYASKAHTMAYKNNEETI